MVPESFTRTWFVGSSLFTSLAVIVMNVFLQLCENAFFVDTGMQFMGEFTGLVMNVGECGYKAV